MWSRTDHLSTDLDCYHLKIFYKDSISTRSLFPFFFFNLLLLNNQWLPSFNVLSVIIYICTYICMWSGLFINLHCPDQLNQFMSLLNNSFYFYAQLLSTHSAQEAFSPTWVIIEVISFHNYLSEINFK